ncbi:MAG: hypothetical protein KJO18_01470, partial [Acidimicrobiia bacterium]|nr:hypothetical protein [Acidimicrobiia bacterium]
VVVIFAVSKGYMDDIDLDKVAAFELGLRDFIRSRHAGILETIKSTGKLPEGDELGNAIQAFKSSFTGEGPNIEMPTAAAAAEPAVETEAAEVAEEVAEIEPTEEVATDTADESGTEEG